MSKCPNEVFNEIIEGEVSDCDNPGFIDTRCYGNTINKEGEGGQGVVTDWLTGAVLWLGHGVFPM